MNLWGALAGGFIGTLVLTTGLRAANELGLTRVDLPFLLGTAVTSDRSKAAASSSFVSMSTDLSERRRVESGFRWPRTRISSPFVMPPSRPPARFVSRMNSRVSAL